MSPILSMRSHVLPGHTAFCILHFPLGEKEAMVKRKSPGFQEAWTVSKIIACDRL